MQLPEEAAQMGAPSHWLGDIGVPDVDAAVAKTQSLGATIYMPGMDIATVGRIAVLADPQGATIALYCPESGTTDNSGDDGNPIGKPNWHALYTTDPEAAWRFYTAMFGWTKTDSMDMGEMGEYRMYGNGGATLGGMMVKPPMMPTSAWLYDVSVSDLETAIEAAKTGGAQVLMGPHDVPGGDRMVQLMDPQGAAFALHSKIAQA